MSAIPWATTLAAIDEKIPSAAGETLKIGQQIRASLDKLGQEYDTRFSAQVSSAKDAFAAIVTAAHNEADRVCRYAESLVGTADPALLVDLYSNVAILARCDTAIGAATGDLLKRTLRAARSRVVSAYGGGDQSGSTTSRYMTFRGTDALPNFRNYERSVRELELAMQAQIKTANDWIALVDYA